MATASKHSIGPLSVTDAVEVLDPSSSEERFDPRLVLRPLISRWRTLALAVSAVVLVTGLASEFLFTRWYKAEAVIRPSKQVSALRGLSGLVSSLGAGSALSALSGAGFGNGHDPQELMAILKSYAFESALAERHKLQPILLGSGGRNESSKRRRDWALYKAMKSRFTTDYDFETMNITLTFAARTPATAERVLSYYLSGLRDRLRTEDVKEAGTAVTAISGEAAKTLDPTLKQQLYDMIARELEREKLAQAEADFAFRVIEPPVASPQKYWPPVWTFCIAAALLSLIGLSAVFILGDHFASLDRQRELDAVAERQGSSQKAGSL